jgi:hypothetical protein
VWAWILGSVLGWQGGAVTGDPLSGTDSANAQP